MNKFKTLYDNLKKFYGRNIKFFNTKDYNMGFKIPRYLPKKMMNMLNRLNFNTQYLRFGNYDFESEEFKSDYNALIQGLDDESIINVNRSMNIYKKYYEMVKKKKVGILELYLLKNLFSPSKAESEKIKKEFSSKIRKYDDNLYGYEDYRLGECKFASTVFFHKHSINELHSLSQIKEKNIIDVGGFIGDSAIVFSPYTNKTIYSFEASPVNFNKIKLNMELNNVKNVTPVNLALGDKIDGKVSIVSILGDDSCIQTAYADDSDNSISSTTLDKFVDENKIDVGLIKVDIEGFEQYFLKGAENTIKTQKPALLISIYHKPDDYLHIKQIIESWDLGYKFKIRCPFDNRLFETLLIAEVYNRQSL